MKTVCITGVSGYIGLATAYKLVEAGYRVIGTGTHPEKPATLPVEVVYRQLDVADVMGQAQFLAEYSVSTVFHCAGIKYVGVCAADPERCFFVNTEGTKAVLDAMVTAAVPHIVYTSTYAVYDWSGDTLVLLENSPTKPATVYGESKLQSEQHIQDYAARGLIAQYHILRYANVIGVVPDVEVHTPQNFLDKIIVSAYLGESIQIKGGDYMTSDGTAARDFIDIEDICTIHKLILRDASSGIYNVSSGKTSTLRSLVETVERVTQRVVDYSIHPVVDREPSSISIPHTRIAALLNGWQPQYTLTESIEQLNTRLAR